MYMMVAWQWAKEILKTFDFRVPGRYHCKYYSTKQPSLILHHSSKGGFNAIQSFIISRVLKVTSLSPQVIAGHKSLCEEGPSLETSLTRSSCSSVVRAPWLVLLWLWIRFLPGTQFSVVPSPVAKQLSFTCCTLIASAMKWCNTN